MAYSQSFSKQGETNHPPQPLEVIKTTMAANRGDSFAGAMGRIWGRGGIFGCKCPFNTRF